MYIKFTLAMLALICIIIALANPQGRGTEKTVRHSGIDVAIVMDLSRSMLATDVQPNRFETAKKTAQQLVDQLPGEKIALVSFAEEPVTLLPLTPDHAAVKKLDSIQ